MVALALAKAEADLNGLIAIRCSDEDWSGSDVDIEFAVELALSHVERMKAMKFPEFDTFALEWYKVASAVNLGQKQISRPDCWFANRLRTVCAMFDQTRRMAEFAEGKQRFT